MYEWTSEEEKQIVQRKLETECIISDPDVFLSMLKGEEIIDKDTRYLVWMAPARFLFDPKNDDGVSGPLEAIQGALDLHLDGGWDWLVWDVRQKVGFSIDTNSYIYEPLEAWAEKRMVLDSMGSGDLRSLIDQAREVLKKRGEL